MRAIDILFDEIDKINTEIKAEDDTYNKVLLALEIKKIIEVIEQMEELQSEAYLPWECRTYTKDYI